MNISRIIDCTFSFPQLKKKKNIQHLLGMDHCLAGAGWKSENIVYYKKQGHDI